MTALQNLATEELQKLARQWREEALRGVREARGLAHEYEAELRRRVGAPDAASVANLDLRPLDQREPTVADRPWWRLW